MLAPYLAFAPHPVAAQNTNPDIFVLDFNNQTRVGGALLGRVAAAQMSLHLSESANWNVIPDAQVQRRIQELGLKQPFDRIDRVRIANGAEASAIVYGSITDVVVTGGATPQALTKIQVLVEDVQTGRLINGAVTEGRSTPRMGFTGDADVLIEEALGKAAFRARDMMDTFRLPEGTVLNTTIVGEGDVQDLVALINVGARQGARRGMRMVVTRQREVVGELKLVNVDSDISTGQVLSNTQGVRPEDRVRAVFNFQDFAPSRSQRRSMAPTGGTRVAALPGKTLATEPGAKEDPSDPVRVARVGRGDEFIQFRAAQDRNLQLAQATTDIPPPVVVDEIEVDSDGSGDGGGGGRRKILNNGTVRMLAGGLLLLGLLSLGGSGGSNNTRPDSVEAFGFQLRIGAPGAFIRVTFDRPKSIPSTQVLQYVIYRFDPFVDSRIVGALQSDAAKSFLDSESARTLANVYTGIPGSDDPGGPGEVTVPGIVPGTQYRYQVATVFRSRILTPGEEGGGGGGGGGGEEGTIDRISPLSQSTPWATAIAPPVIGRPIGGEQVQLSELGVTFQQTPGADSYIIWVSRDPNFAQGRRLVFRVPRTVPVDQGGPTT
ncbi:MAG TPA: hypothetical protein VK689_19470, partial [Armatimonadota bacterium]|nr:hypothetical protein [Armatimonadota bacterium]